MPPSPAPRASHYCDVDTLRALITDAQTTGCPSDELARVLLKIAGGVWDRYRFTRDRDDFVQEVVTHLLQNPLRKADCQKHVFNYLTTCAIRYGMKLRDKELGDQRRFQGYAEELVEAGRELPSRNERHDRDELPDAEGVTFRVRTHRAPSGGRRRGRPR